MAHQRAARLRPRHDHTNPARHSTPRAAAALSTSGDGTVITHQNLSLLAVSLTQSRVLCKASVMGSMM